MPFKPTNYLPYDFANRRHIGPSPDEMAQMLQTVGAPDLASLIDDTLPVSIRHASCVAPDWNCLMEWATICLHHCCHVLSTLSANMRGRGQ